MVSTEKDLRWSFWIYGLIWHGDVGKKVYANDSVPGTSRFSRCHRRLASMALLW